MTETIYDLYGWGSPEVIKHEALRLAWCFSHRIPYSQGWSTAGFYSYCQACEYEMGLWLNLVDEFVTKVKYMYPLAKGFRFEVLDKADKLIQTSSVYFPLDKSFEV